MLVDIWFCRLFCVNRVAAASVVVAAAFAGVFLIVVVARVVLFVSSSSFSVSGITPSPPLDRLVDLVVKASASGAEDPGFESRLRRDFSGVESYQ